MKELWVSFLVQKSVTERVSLDEFGGELASQVP
jgi:hypothetical protein